MKLSQFKQRMSEENIPIQDQEILIKIYKNILKNT